MDGVVIVKSNGIGHYEFWGRTGFDSRDAYVSNCCEYQVYDDPECMVESDIPSQEDYGDGN